MSWLWVLEYIPVVVGLGVAILVARYTKATNRLTQQLAEIELNPYVIVVLDRELDESDSFELVVRNVGRRPSRRIRVNLAFNHGSPISQPVEERLSKVAFLREVISFLGPSQEVRAWLGTSTELQLLKIFVDVSYTREMPGIEVRVFRDSFVLESDVLLGLRRPFAY